MEAVAVDPLGRSEYFRLVFEQGVDQREGGILLGVQDHIGCGLTRGS